jgi:hypothetical protein
MNQKKGNAISRRDFAQRAIFISAAASLVPATLSVAQQAPTTAPPVQDQANLPRLAPASQQEADSRLQQILALHADQFNDSQKALLKTLCISLQPSLDRVRAYPLENGDVPALLLRPLMEREKKPQTSPAAARKNS